MRLLSIVIPSYCRADLLRRCLASIERHAPADTEVIVVDDSSPQGTIANTAREFGWVRVVRLPRRSGFCAAANCGIAAARAQIVELLNDDTEVTPHWATTALAVFDDTSVAAVAPLVLTAAGSVAHAGVPSASATPPAAEDLRIDSAGDRYHLGGIAAKRGHGQTLAPPYLRSCRVFGASASSAFYRRDLLLAVGGFPESFVAYFEDVDVSFRLNRAGYQIRFEPASRVLHHVSASYGRPGRRLLEQQSFNEERVFWRNIPSREMGRALPWHVAVLTAKAWRRWQEGTLAPFLCGRLRVLGELAALRRHRRALAETNPRADLKAWRVDSHFWDALQPTRKST